MLLKQMKYFITVVDLHSFTEAAEQCFISQSAISQQIKALEKELGVRLFERSKRQFSLTVAGEYFYRHGKVLLDEIEDFKEETIRRGEDQELNLTIGYPKNFSTNELLETIVEFKRIYPEVNISVVSGTHEELFELLVDHRIDMKISEQRRTFNKDYYNEISKIIDKNNMRVDVHPDQFCVLNSTNKETINNSIEILKYHINILEALKIKNPVIVLHTGSSVFGKEKSITRFVNNFNKLPDNIKNSIVIENDDKIYNAKDVLSLCKKINRPMVLDYHHHICNPCDNIDGILAEIFDTWKDIRPKVHFSSSKNKTKRDFRSHHDYINSDDFIQFIEKIKKYNVDIDVMIEAKAKDDALFRLVRELKYKTNYTFIDDTSFEV